MAHLIDKDALVAEIEKRQRILDIDSPFGIGGFIELELVKDVINTLEVKEVDLIIHTIIAECCNWLAVHTELNHEQIEDCRNLMLTVKDEQLKAKQG